MPDLCSSPPPLVSSWPVKILRGTFSATKRMKLENRYAQRRIRVVFAP